LHLLQINLEHPRHEFWADSLSLSDAVKKLESRMRGHRQITDAYLVGLARHRKGRLATMDKGLAALAEAEDAGVVELIPRGSEFT
jgi:predicted nucleic acid-binding protein